MAWLIAGAQAKSSTYTIPYFYLSVFLHFHLSLLPNFHISVLPCDYTVSQDESFGLQVDTI